jgi:CBS domain containing-hemolysin-like protein
MIGIVALGLLISGVYLSALFSGSETGFYRISRVRVAMDARTGNRSSQWMFWFTSHPAWFVATTLVGNNVANYMTSLAVVLAVGSWSAGEGHRLELLGTVLLAPVVFVLGELLPKRLYFDAPNRLLRRSTPQFVVFAIVLAPLAGLLAAISSLLGRLAGHSPEWDGTVLGRSHLERLLHEGHEEGLLLQAQRHLIQGVFQTVARPVTEAMTPMNRVVGVPEDADSRSVRRLARRHGMANVLVRTARGRPQWIGYVNIADFTLRGGELTQSLRPLVSLPADESHLQALLRLQGSGEHIGLIVDAQGEPLGIANDSDLTEPLFRSSV